MTISVYARVALAMLAPINVVRIESRRSRHTTSGHLNRALRAKNAIARGWKDGFVVVYLVPWAGGRKAEHVGGFAARWRSLGPISHRGAP